MNADDDEVSIGFEPEPEPKPEPAKETEAGEDQPQPEGETDPEEGEGEDRKKRSKPVHQRIAELVARGHDKDRRIAELEEQISGRQPPEKKAEAVPAEKPDPAKYEFGTADPEYGADLAAWKVDQRLAEQRQADREAEQERETARVLQDMNRQWNEQAEAAVTKYPDFNEVVMETAAAGEWPCSFLVTAALADSEVGADMAYHLAKNPKEAQQIDRYANPQSREYDPVQAARMIGRLEARFEAASEKKPEIRPTSAPEPPKHTARGSSGKYKVEPSTDDFAAFKREYGKELGIR